jgi:hypothetical protein
MQTRNQHSKRPRDWKVIAAAATVSALGVSGLALAGNSGEHGEPDPINLSDRTSITEVTTTSSIPTTLAQLLADSADSQSVESPFDDPATVSAASVSAASPASPASVASKASADSPAPAPAPAPADSPASVDSASADSAGSSDNSADS